MSEEGEGVDWDEPLPTSSSGTGEEEELPDDVRRQNENLKKLEMYVQQMSYRPAEPIIAKERTESLAKPKKTNIVGTYTLHGYVQEPEMRKERLKQAAAKYNAISTEQLEQIIKNHKTKERKREDLMKRKQELYYEMLTKLERQCRTQYLNVLIKKFATFIAKLATTMHIPPQLVEPYSRMQRGLFCNILLAIGVQPSNQAAIYYTTQEALEYEVCHKLAHALLSLIIKALDTASTKNPEDMPAPENDLEMDNYIKDRLMCAAERKIVQARVKENQLRGLLPCRGHRAGSAAMGSVSERYMFNEYGDIYKNCDNFKYDKKLL